MESVYPLRVVSCPTVVDVLFSLIDQIENYETFIFQVIWKFLYKKSEFGCTGCPQEVDEILQVIGKSG